VASVESAGVFVAKAVDSRLFSGLSAFAAVLEAGSFVRAGEALGLTQSAVSRSVQRLEKGWEYVSSSEARKLYCLPRTVNVFAQKHSLFFRS
jgi:DNA-binding IclR family transcriptional regulator